MQQTIEQVELSDILPSPTNPRKYFNPVKLNELAESIKKLGVIQAIKLRPFPKKPGKFEIVFGERRFRGSTLAGLTTIPAVIEDLTDDQVIDMQFIENIERDDVHPMDEAYTFDQMMRSKSRVYLIAEIAAKIGKSESYIIQRVQLLQLIPALQKDFWDDKFLIGHAILFARLTEADQRETMKNLKKGEYYGTVKDTHDYINRNIIRLLATAPFKMDDSTLTVACGAGACTNCFKRSGVNTLLFADIKKGDRCFDKICFQQKSEAWVKKEVAYIIESGQTIPLVEYGGASKLNPEISKMAKEVDVKILNFWKDDVTNYERSGYVKTKCLMVSGTEMGSYKTFYKPSLNKQEVKQKVATGATIAPAEIDEQISTIQQRLKRGVELDYQKVQEAIVKDLRDSYPKDKPVKGFTDAEKNETRLFINFILFSLVNNWNNISVLKILGLTDVDGSLKSKPENLFMLLLNITDAQMSTILKLIILDKFGSMYTDGENCAIVRRLASVLDIDVDRHVSLQDIAAKKRIANAEKRIADLKEQKKALSKKKKDKAEFDDSLGKGIKQLLKKSKKSAPDANKVAPDANEVAA